eukprot:scaffold379912_cov19-Prasinocladus_malaysianus.AAC.1
MLADACIELLSSRGVVRVNLNCSPLTVHANYGIKRQRSPQTKRSASHVKEDNIIKKAVGIETVTLAGQVGDARNGNGITRYSAI